MSIYVTALLLGAVVTVLTELIKFLSKKYGKELASAVVLLVVFVLVVLGSLAWSYFKDVLGVETLEMFGVAFASAIALYELILKRLIPSKK